MHARLQVDLIASLFHHPISAFVRIYGGGTLVLHWATVDLRVIAGAFRVVEVRGHDDRPVGDPLLHPGIERAIGNARTALMEGAFGQVR